MNKRVRAGVFLALSLALCGEICAASSDDSHPREIKVTARRFEFAPDKITVRKGEKVRLVVTSEDVEHGIAIEGFDIDVAVKAGTTKIVEFTPEREGRFKIYCSVFCGNGHPNMEGELIVTAADAPEPSNINVRFDEKEPGVVYVEAGGERIKIETATKTVTRMSELEKPADKPLADKPLADKTLADKTLAVATGERASGPASQPYDYRLVNVPTPKRVARHGLNIYFTHRFSEPINDEGIEDLFGLDGFSASSFGVMYGITDRLYASVYRSPLCQKGICKTIEVGLGYHLFDEAGRSPLTLQAYASVEGNDNFKRNFTYNLQARLARSVTRYATLFFSPAVHINSNGQGRFNVRPQDFFPPQPIAADFRLGQHTGSFGFGASARIRPSASLIFEYTPRAGFKLGRIEPVFDEELLQIVGFRNVSKAEIGFGIEKRIGRHGFTLTFSNTQATTTSRYNSSNLALPPSKLLIGFNLFRRLL